MSEDQQELRDQMREAIEAWRRKADLDARAGAPVGTALNEALDALQQTKVRLDEQTAENERLVGLVSQYADRGIANGERAEEAERQSYRRWLAWQSARRGRGSARFQVRALEQAFDRQKYDAETYLTACTNLRGQLAEAEAERDRLREAEKLFQQVKVDTQQLQSRITKIGNDWNQYMQEMDHLLHSLVLYIRWRYVTQKLTTRQKNLFADALKRHAIRIHGPDGEDPDSEMAEYPSYAPRWWMDDSEQESF